ncbi:response regulator [Pleionea sp. CnH1-48]|uniref:response regulator n=1 Tax=Pleionea sp. CnH1-48 TaxID=2954494 RepID=UPI002097BD79|nr:response regulator [Pleionea sp. CnH1-48]MCO7223439.1 hypothetical protein [Pleionea sp. CnH1-48]
MGLSVVIAIYILYSTAYQNPIEDTKLSISSQKELVSAVGRFDAINSQTDHQGGALGGTLSQVVDAHKHYNCPGEITEFEQCDILLLDIHLPELADGLELLDKFPAMKTIIYTSKVDGQLKKQWLDCGVFAVFEKGTELQSLLTLLKAESREKK